MIDKTTIYALVEGDGEIQAAPELIRRICNYRFNVNPYNASGRGNITRVNSFERLLNIIRKQADCVGLLVLLDAEDEDVACPPQVAYSLANTAKHLNLPFPTAIVCATCEYESWFLHNLDRIAPKYQLTTSVYAGDPEQECAAKGWLTAHMTMGHVYKETRDQVKMTALIDIERTALSSRSFRRLLHAVEELLTAIDNGKTHVSPQRPGVLS